MLDLNISNLENVLSVIPNELVVNDMRNYFTNYRDNPRHLFSDIAGTCGKRMKPYLGFCYNEGDYIDLYETGFIMGHGSKIVYNPISKRFMYYVLTYGNPPSLKFSSDDWKDMYNYVVEQLGCTRGM